MPYWEVCVVDHVGTSYQKKVIAEVEQEVVDGPDTRTKNWLPTARMRAYAVNLKITSVLIHIFPRNPPCPTALPHRPHLSPHHPLRPPLPRYVPSTTHSIASTSSSPTSKGETPSTLLSRTPMIPSRSPLSPLQSHPNRLTPPWL